VACQPAITNLCTNPSAETNLTSISVIGTATRTQEVGDANSTGTSYVEVTADTDGHGVLWEVPAAPELIYAISLDAWLLSGAADWNLTILTDAVAFADLPITVTAAKQRFSVILDATADTAMTEVQVYVLRTTAVASVIGVDAVQVEVGSAATNYADGSLGAGYAWTGVAHESTSTRSATADCSGSLHMCAFQLRPRVAG
jgi:hypothetical protein